MGRKSKKGKKQNDSSESSDSASLSLSDHEFAVELKLMRLKGYDKIKVPQLLKSAAEMSGWKNSLISQIIARRKGSEKELLSWLSSPLEGVELSSDKFPVLNRVQAAWSRKGGRFGVDFQALQECSVRQGMQVQGHVLLGRICKKFRLDEERGMSLSQQHLLALKPQGVEIKDLEVFRYQVEFVLSSLETSEYPNEAILRSWLYECLKNVPKLALQIDKFVQGSIGWRQHSDFPVVVAIHDRLHWRISAWPHTASILNALRSKVDAASAPIEKKDKNTDKKKEKAETTKDQRDKVDVAVASSSKTQPKAKSNPNAKSSQSKADGKGGGKDKKEVVAGERGTPCLFYSRGKA